MGLWVKLRIAARATVLILWTVSLFFFRCLALLLIPFSRSAEEWCRRMLLRVWAIGVTWIVRMSLTIEGNAPKPPYYLVTNHLSYLDIVLLARTAGCVYVSRSDLADHPVLGFLAKVMNTIFIDRAKARDTHRVNEQINDRLDKGYGVHMFAESKISQDAQVHPFKPPLLQPAIERGIPVHYAALSYSTPPGVPAAKDVIVWKDGVTLGQNMAHVLGLPKFSAVISYGNAPLTAPDRKELAEKLYLATLERFTPVD
ncbi:MAG: lysophospholipid acyltransferase family protein [Candidatus Hydrogenedentes bacterium]|nr:lysophospholipid acyltransferase family protein [Candidatus Hydrogenedentota bacterium]